MDTFVRMAQLLELSIQVDLQNAAAAKPAVVLPTPAPVQPAGPPALPPKRGKAPLVSIKKEVEEHPPKRAKAPAEPKKRKMHKRTGAASSREALPRAEAPVASPMPSKAVCPVSFGRPKSRAQGSWQPARTVPAPTAVQHRRADEKGARQAAKKEAHGQREEHRRGEQGNKRHRLDQHEAQSHHERHRHRVRLVAAPQATASESTGKQRPWRTEQAPRAPAQGTMEDDLVPAAAAATGADCAHELQAATTFGGRLLDVRSASQKRQTEESEDSSSPSTSREMLGRRGR